MKNKKKCIFIAVILIPIIIYFSYKAGYRVGAKDMFHKVDQNYIPFTILSTEDWVKSVDEYKKLLTQKLDSLENKR